jgi:hypothetical protein
VTDLAEREVGEGGSLEIATPEINPENAQRARSVALPSGTSLLPVTQRVQRAGAKAASLLEKPGTIPHSQPPTFVQAYARHRECASHYRTPLLRWLRMTWGWFHLLVIKSLTGGLDHYTESPLAALIVVAIGVTIWFFS